MATSGNLRLHFVDNLRASLVVLVVLHHLALVYGAAAPFYYFEPPSPSQFGAFQGLLIFVLFNQSFFMGLLFLIAGYFTPSSYDRRGARAFVKDKILRLGLPLVFFVFVLNPLSALGSFLMPASLTGITRAPIWADYPKLIGMGPLWFVALLLVFNGGYAAWRGVRGSAGGAGGAKTVRVPGPVAVLVFLLLLAGVSYLMRLDVPLGRSVAGFPTLAYLPQYLGFFILGLVAQRGDWFRRIPDWMGLFGVLLAVVASVFLFPLAFSGSMFVLRVRPDLSQAFGNGTWRSAIYALWDSAVAVGLGLGLLVTFRKLFDRGGRLGVLLSSQSYAVYLLHTPVVVYLAYLIRTLDAAPVPKFLLASVLAVPVCFVVAWVVRRIPGVSRIV